MTKLCERFLNGGHDGIIEVGLYYLECAVANFSGDE